MSEQLDYTVKVDYDTDDVVVSARRGEDALAKMAREGEASAEKIERAQKELERSTKDIAREQRRLEREYRQVAEQLDPNIRRTSQLRNAQRTLDAAYRKGLISQREHVRLLRLAKVEYQQSAPLVTRLAQRVRGYGAAMLAVAALAAGGSIASIGGDLEDLTARLETATGSAEAADEKFEELFDFAGGKPFQVEEFVDAFLRLQNVGIKPTLETLRTVGDVAAGQAKDISQFAEAVADATTGEFERLKEFGILAKTQGDSVTFVYRGVETKVKKSANEISKALLSIGRTNFSGSMERQSERLSGAVSTLKDSWTRLAKAIFESGVGDMLKRTANAAASLLNNISEIIEGFDRFALVVGRQSRLLEENNKILAELEKATPEKRATRAAERLEEWNRALEDNKKLLEAVEVARHELAIAPPPLEDEARKQLEDANTALQENGLRINAAHEAWALAAQAAKDLGISVDDTTRDIVDNSEAIEKLNDKLEKNREKLRRFIDDLKKKAELSLQVELDERAAKRALEELKGILAPQDVVIGVDVDADELEDRIRQLEEETILRYTQLTGESLELGVVISGDFESRLERLRQLLELLPPEVRIPAEIVLEDVAGALSGGIDPSVEPFDEIKIDVKPELDDDALTGSLAEAAEKGAAPFRDKLTDAFKDATSSLKDELGSIAQDLADAIINGEEFDAREAATNLGGRAVSGFLENYGVPPEIGDAIGRVFTDLTLDLLGLGEKISQSFAHFEARSGRLVFVIEEGEGEVLETTDQALRAVTDTVQGIADLFGATIDGIPGVQFQVRQDRAGRVKVWVDGVMTLVEDVDAALDLMVVTLLSRSQFSGLPPEVESALRNFAGSTVEEVERVLEIAVSLRDINLGELRSQLRAQWEPILNTIREGLRTPGLEGFAADAFARLPAISREGRDALLGIQQDQEALIQARADAWEAEQVILIAQLKALELRLEAEAASAQSIQLHGQSLARHAELVVRGAEGVALGGRAVSEALAGMTQAQLASAEVSATATDAILARLRETIADLESIPAITGEEISAAARRLRGSAGDGRLQQREALEAEARLVEMIAQGASDAEIAAERFRQEMEALEERQRSAGISEAAIAERRRNEELARTLEILGEVRSEQRELNESEFRQALRAIEERRDAQVAELELLGATADEIAEVNRLREAEIQALERELALRNDDLFAQGRGLDSSVDTLFDFRDEIEAARRETIDALIGLVGENNLANIFLQIEQGVLDLEDVLARLPPDVAALLQQLFEFDRALESFEFSHGLSFVRGLQSELEALGQSLPPEVVEALRVAEIELARIRRLEAIARLAEAGALGQVLDTLGVSLEEFLQVVNDAYDLILNPPEPPPEPPAPPAPSQQSQEPAVDPVAELARVQESMESFILGLRDNAVDPLERQIAQLTRQYEEHREAALELGLSVAELTDAYLDEVARLRHEAREQALEPVRRALEELRDDDPRVSDGQRFDELFVRYEEALARAQAGDREALREAAELAIELRDAGRDFFGSSQGAFGNLLDRLQGDLEGLESGGLFPGASAVEEATYGVLVDIRDILSGGGHLPPASLPSSAPQIPDLAGLNVNFDLPTTAAGVVAGALSYQGQLASQLLEATLTHHRRADATQQAAFRELVRRQDSVRRELEGVRGEIRRAPLGAEAGRLPGGRLR